MCDFQYNERIIDFVDLLGLDPDKSSRLVQIWEERDRQLEDTMKNCPEGGGSTLGFSNIGTSAAMPAAGGDIMAQVDVTTTSDSRLLISHTTSFIMAGDSGSTFEGHGFVSLDINGHGTDGNSQLDAGTVYYGGDKFIMSGTFMIDTNDTTNGGWGAGPPWTVRVFVNNFGDDFSYVQTTLSVVVLTSGDDGNSVIHPQGS